ncbi:MAG: SBBP repeat-containing protein [Promethearchaeota archaeon]
MTNLETLPQGINNSTRVNNTGDLSTSSIGGVELKYNKTFGGIYMDIGNALAVDSNGDIYVTGTINYASGDANLVLLKYTSGGVLLWNVTWGGSGYEWGYGIVVGLNGSIYVTGYTSSYGAGSYDVVLLKYNSSGALLWNVTWGGPGGEEGIGIVVGLDGSIYVTGYTSSYGAGSYDVVLLKYNFSGALLWNVTWGGINDDFALGVALDQNNNVYVTGYTASYGAGSYDVVLLKYNFSGALLWNVTWGGINYERAYGISVDSNDNIYITGHINTTNAGYGAGSFDVLLLKYTSGGLLLGNTTWGGPNMDTAYGISVDSSDNIYTTGFINTTNAGYGAGSFDIFLIKYSFKALSPPILSKILPNPDTDGNIALNWSNVADAKSYLVYRDTKYIASVNNLTSIVETSSTTYNDTNLTNGTYYYIVIAKSEGEFSNISNCESIIVAIPPSESTPPPSNISSFVPIIMLLSIIATISVLIKKNLFKI